LFQGWSFRVVDKSLQCVANILEKMFVWVKYTLMYAFKSDDPSNFSIEGHFFSRSGVLMISEVKGWKPQGCLTLFHSMGGVGIPLKGCY